MILLDLYCGAGGAAMGYHRAGFEVIGFDIRPQPHYPFEFHQGDVLKLMHANAFSLSGVDVVHASPPCQLWSDITPTRKRGAHRDCLTPTREWLLNMCARGWQGSWVIENVPGAPLREPLVLCGSEFGLSTDIDGQRWHLKRHRLFESNRALMGAGGCYCRLHTNRILSVHGVSSGPKISTGRGRQASAQQSRELMGIDWMSTREVSQAIPPAYTEHIGWQLAGVTT